MSSYWEKRSTTLEILTQKKTDETVKDINRLFGSSIQNINGRVKAVFDRFQKSSGLSESQAKTLLNTAQTKEYRQALLDKLSETKDKEARKEIISILDSPAYAHRISMLEALANEVYIEGVLIGAYENTALTNRLVDIYEHSYYRRTFDIQQFTGEYYDFNRLSSGQVKTAISEPWDGKNYSERVWDNTEQTAEFLRDIVIKGIMTGQDYKSMENSLTAVLGFDSDSGARYKASRLIRTEVNYISGKATQKAYEQAEIDEYVYLATLDKKCCCGNGNRKSCAELDGQHFLVSEAKVGVNKHPMHPFCRCSDYPYVKDKAVGVRSARDENGKSIQVPDDITYDEWYKKYVDESGESGIIETETGMFRKNANIGAFKHLTERMSKSHIRDVAKQCNIDLSKISIVIDKNEDNIDSIFCGMSDMVNGGTIVFEPTAFVNKEELVRTIFHEQLHIQQYRQYGYEYVVEHSDYFEKITYQTENDFILQLKAERKL